MSSRVSIRIAALACVAGLAGVACGGASGGDDSSAPTPAADSTPTVTEASPATGEAGVDADAGAAAVPALLQFTAPLVGGGEIVGDELAGKPTAFWFWSPT